ncbi:hypothetical protein WJX81_000682 [Elliptochloris bilobata]|uniref:BAT2 N-terminal domain-containing protein n=1 Tax=Elliptochloris bilobata TaxID=381761 RepID=A0AAW1QND7_9CHLO
MSVVLQAACSVPCLEGLHGRIQARIRECGRSGSSRLAIMQPVGARPGRRMVSLGKVTAPKPVNLPSQKRENNGLDPTIALVPRSASVWGDPGNSAQAPADATGNSQQPRSRPHSPARAAPAAAPSAWGGAASAGSGRPKAGASLRTDEFPTLGGEGGTGYSSSLGSDGWHERSPWDPPAGGRANGPPQPSFDGRVGFAGGPAGVPPPRHAPGGWTPPSGERWGGGGAHGPAYGDGHGGRTSAGYSDYGPPPPPPPPPPPREARPQPPPPPPQPSASTAAEPEGRSSAGAQAAERPGGGYLPPHLRGRLPPARSGAPPPAAAPPPPAPRRPVDLGEQLPGPARFGEGEGLERAVERGRGRREERAGGRGRGREGRGGRGGRRGSDREALREGAEQRRGSEARAGPQRPDAARGVASQPQASGPAVRSTAMNGGQAPPRAEAQEGALRERRERGGRNNRRSKAERAVAAGEGERRERPPRKACGASRDEGGASGAARPPPGLNGLPSGGVQRKRERELQTGPRPEREPGHASGADSGSRPDSAGVDSADNASGKPRSRGGRKSGGRSRRKAEAGEDAAEGAEAAKPDAPAAANGPTSTGAHLEASSDGGGRPDSGAARSRGGRGRRGGARRRGGRGDAEAGAEGGPAADSGDSAPAVPVAPAKAQANGPVVEAA